jgi:hypothetical protein
MLESYAIQNKIKTDHRLWPKAANSFTRRLNQIRSNLLEGLGIDVQISRVTDSRDGKINTSSIKISQVSPIPPIPPIPQNHEGNQARSAGDILSAGDIIPPTNEIPPIKEAQNHAQNEPTGDIGDIGGIFSTEGVNGNGDGGSRSSYSCYHCDGFHTGNQDYYENHMARCHFRLPAYPSVADLQRYGLKPQGKSWEK